MPTSHAHDSITRPRGQDLLLRSFTWTLAEKDTMSMIERGNGQKPHLSRISEFERTGTSLSTIQLLVHPCHHACSD
jgi:hypothetical protein